MSLLSVQNLTIRFGGLVAVHQLCFEVPVGKIISLIGPNGAGKTTVFNAITGLVTKSDGLLCLDNKPLERPADLSTTLLHTMWGVCTAMVFLIAVNAEDLFKRSVLDLYVYQESFSWRASFVAAGETLINGGIQFTTLPLIIGFLVGLFGSWSLWRSSRSTPDVIIRRGIARTFQNIRLFNSMTALENVMLGEERHHKSSLLDALLYLPRYFNEQRSSELRAKELLELVGLSAHGDSIAGSLPYGMQRRLEIARALASRPYLLLLDEPAAGMNPTESEELLKLIRIIRDRGVTVLLIEHDMKVVMNISDRIIVLDYGNKIAEGTPTEIAANPAVIKAYLGSSAEVPA